MIRNWTLIKVLALAAILLAACTQDELAEQGNTLPEGEYPLQIGSVSITAESSEEPWTRVAENEDGTGSEWEWDGMEKFAVRLGDETAVYTLNPDHTMTADRQLYWKSTAPATVTAWYPVVETVDLSGQDKGLVYVLRATADNASYDTPVSLQFKHQLAKVRVVTKGTVDVRHIAVTNAPVGCSVQDGIVTSGVNERVDNYLYETEYEGIGTCWEICLPPCSVQQFMVMSEAGGSSYFNIDNSVTLEAGKVHTITITAVIDGTQTIDLSTLTDTRVINDNGTYYVTGTGQYGIRVTNGNPNIYLEDAQISVSSGNAIDIQGGNPTIHVKGNDNEVSSSDGAGIYVAGSSTVTITGNSRDDALTTRGGNGGSGIGGNHATCGNIEISNMTVHAHGSDENGDFLSAGIGGSGDNGCGTITIDNATISAYGASDGAAGNMSSPGIGGGLYGDDKGTYSTITIKNNSQVSVQRGSNRSDYIGSGGSTMNPANSPNGIDATVDETSTITPLN